MAILTASGRVALAIAVVAQPLHLAWGSGAAAWDAATPAEPVDATALVAEVGRRTVTTVRYCTPDANGDLIVPTGRYLASASPTNSIYMRTDFDYTDGSSAVIREFGIFMGTQLKAGLPSGQLYFAPADIASPGTLLTLQREAKITRSAATRQSFELVLTL